ncbi:hypothetical protein Tco_0698029, partial [Tanacetum coccineum]
ENCLDASTVVNKEAAAHSMVSNQSMQHTFHVPSLATYDTAELLESSSSAPDYVEQEHSQA